MPFAFRLEATSQGARAGTLITDHCELPTPVFMPVGTQGTVKGITVDGIRTTGRAHHPGQRVPPRACAPAST